MSEHEKTVPADPQANQQVRDAELEKVAGGAGQPAESALWNVSAHTARALGKAAEASLQKPSGSAIKTTNTSASIFEIPPK